MSNSSLTKFRKKNTAISRYYKKLFMRFVLNIIGCFFKNNFTSGGRKPSIIAYNVCKFKLVADLIRLYLKYMQNNLVRVLVRYHSIYGFKSTCRPNWSCDDLGLNFDAPETSGESQLNASKKKLDPQEACKLSVSSYQQAPTFFTL